MIIVEEIKKTNEALNLIEKLIELTSKMAIIESTDALKKLNSVRDLFIDSDIALKDLHS